MGTLKMKLLLAGGILVFAAVVLGVTAFAGWLGEKRWMHRNAHPDLKKRYKKEHKQRKRNRRVACVSALVFLFSGVALSIPAGLDYRRDLRRHKQEQAEAEAFRFSLGYACMVKDTEKVGELLIGGADPNELRDGWTPLMYACQYDESYENENATVIVQTLIDHGANVNTTESGGYTALMFAAKNDALLPAARLLIENGAEVNLHAGDMTPLSLACFYGAGQIVDELLNKGARVDGDFNPLPSALYPDGFAKYGILKALLDAGADTAITVYMTDDNGESGDYTPAECIDMDEADYQAAGYPLFSFGDEIADWEENYRLIRSLPGLNVTDR